ncbi:MAG TPA: DUF3422 domain-containing protein [Hyphomicrobiaceae bacterium]|nr:DUF3422 domain-containing protein [Hyphomicrobiaceae bacterium]
MSPLPQEFPLRRALNEEAHARPPEALRAPQRITFLALYDAGIERVKHEAPLRELCKRYMIEPPPAGVSHFSGDCGKFRVKWEKHTEFTRYKFIIGGTSPSPFAEPALQSVPQEWLSSLPGEIISATHVALLPFGRETPDVEKLAGEHFIGNTIVGSLVADGGALAITDYRIRDDGFSRLLVLDRNLTPRQAGRTVQRLLEMEAYRILAMLALPIARELSPSLTTAERDLVDITAAMADVAAVDEPALLDRLTRLEAQIQKRHFETASRFSAAEAYYRLIQRRTEELREKRVEGLQTFREFVERRLSPAMSTITATSARHEKLALRIAQATQLLSTRVDVSRQQHNQRVLESMNQRVLLQLRLQQTVEGLSVAAITYYLVGLLSYLFKGAAVAGLVGRADLLIAISVPLVAALVAIGVRGARRFLGGGSDHSKSA